MGYQECYKETNELAAERYELVAERIAEIAEAAQAPEPFAEYFRTNAAYLQSLRALYEKGKSGSLAARSMEECEADNEALYGEILPEAYGHSYANPAYAAARLGETFGGALSLLAAHLRTACGEVFRGNLVQLTIAMELFVEVYNCFEGAAADALPQEKRETLLRVLAQDPRPGYQHEAGRIYGFPFGGFEVRFTVADGVLTVLSAEKV